MKTDPVTLTRALDWINRQLKETPGADKLKVVEAAAIRFDLGPLDEEWLLREIAPDQTG